MAGDRLPRVPLVATCKLSGVNQVDHLTDTLRAILEGHARFNIKDLMNSRHAKTSGLAL